MAWNLLLQLICILVAAFYFVNAEPPERIVGGVDVNPREVTYMVSIQLNQSHFCGGAILNRRFVLTAAHCLIPLRNISLTRITVLSGTIRLGFGGRRHRVAAIYPHPRYALGPDGYSWQNDIGIIKVASNITYNALQTPIALPTANVPVGANAMVTGWGSLSTPPPLRFSTRLQKLNLTILANTECQNYFFDTITSDMVCAYDRLDTGVCAGDSGGPLVINNTVVGVVSGGIPCAEGYPDIFGNVFSMMSFVNQTLLL